MTSAPAPLPASLYRTLGAFRGALSQFTHENQRCVHQAGLTPQQFSLLVLLGGAGDGALSVGEVAGQLRIAHNSAVGLAQRAQRAGLISRTADPARGQRTLLHLTPEGTRRLEAVTRVVITQLSAERVALIETLARWNAVLDRQDELGAGTPPAYRVDRAGPRDRPLVWRLLQLHLHDLSGYHGTVPDERGQYGYAIFDAYWQGGRHGPHLLRLARRPAAFALVERLGEDPGRPWHLIHDLHVLRPYRGRGLGAALAGELTRAQPGRWSVEYHERNLPGATFWHQTLRHLTREPVREEPGEAPRTRRLSTVVPQA